jgi:5'-3' exonuclease
MMPPLVMKIFLKNPQKQMKKMKNGKLLMFIKHLVQMMMMMMMKMMMIVVVIHIIVVFDHGKTQN